MKRPHSRAAEWARRPEYDAVAGRPFNPHLITELEGLANRGYTSGFLERRPSQDYQSYETGHSVATRSQFVGEVKTVQDGWADACTGPTLLAGDFNATSITRPYQILCGRLEDAQRQLGLRPSVKTFPSGFPAIRIDHCFVSPHIEITGVKTVFSPLARTASDHLPLIVDFRVRPES